MNKWIVRTLRARFIGNLTIESLSDDDLLCVYTYWRTYSGSMDWQLFPNFAARMRYQVL